MAWIESHEDIWAKAKLDRMMDMLEGKLPAMPEPMQRALVVGMLNSLWHFTLANAWRDGNLEPWGDRGIERAARWCLDSNVFVAALREARWLDGSTIHDWLDFAGDIVLKRLEREEKRNSRRQKVKSVPRAAPAKRDFGPAREATVPYRTVPDRTGPTTGADGAAPGALSSLPENHNSKGNDSSKRKAFQAFMDGVIRDYCGAKPGSPEQSDREVVATLYTRFGRSGRDILRLAEGDPVRARAAVDAIGRRMQAWSKPWSLDTTVKWVRDYILDPKGYERETQETRAR